MSDQRVYPRGRIAQGSGDLIDVTNIKLDVVNGAKQQHTLRQRGAGVSLGNEETTVSFDSIISEDGPERDYFADVKAGRIKQIRIKIPGMTLTVNGIHSAASLEVPLDDAIKLSMTFIGKLD